MKKRILLLSCIFLLTCISVILTESFSAKAAVDSPTLGALLTDEKPAFSLSKKTLYENYKSYNLILNNTNEDMLIAFSSSDDEIASVDSEGTVTPHNTGKAVITADIIEGSSNYSCSIKITVKKPYDKIEASTEGIFVGNDFHFKIKRYGHKGITKWSLTGSQYASLMPVAANECVLTGISQGVVNITAESLGKIYEFEVRVYEGSGEMFVVSPTSSPYNKAYTTYSTYNKNTKHYYLLRSYLERLDKSGGGMLVLRSGTYNITNTLCIPSNTTIQMEDGVVIRKSDTTGTSLLTATRSLFQTVSYRHAAQEGVFSGYNGEHDIVITGTGSVIMDMNNINCAMIVAAHCRNLTIKGITFTNMNTNHFIELDASKNVSIIGNLFAGYVSSSTFRKEAINIDTPDNATGGFKQYWTSYDGTPNDSVYINDNVFMNLETAIGTHKYTEGKLHTNIQIKNNYFYNIFSYAVRGMNWDAPVISENSFYNPLEKGPNKGNDYAIILNGVVRPMVTLNRIENYSYPISAYHWKNTGSGKDYAVIYNKFTESELDIMRQNISINNKYSYMSYYELFDDFTDESLVKYKFNN